MIDDFSFLEKNQKRIEKALNKALPAKDFSNITEAIHYSVLDGGKRIRPQLIYLVADSLNLNLKDDYSPLTQTFKLSLFDECSRLDISYLDERFNDNYNLQPSETISISFHMDYLGFFGYEQSSNLFFDEPGNFNYGL